MIEKQAIADALPTLLLGASIVSQPKLDEALLTAKNLNVPLARALAMLNTVSETTMRVVLEAEELVRTDKATVDLALKALRLARQNNMTMEDAIGVLNSVHKKTQTVQSIANPLTQLLLSADLINPEQLGRAVIKAKDTGM
jgi:gamma-glutamylcysteine synthetase